jgi:hypothetical protein
MGTYFLLKLCERIVFEGLKYINVKKKLSYFILSQIICKLLVCTFLLAYAKFLLLYALNIFE